MKKGFTFIEIMIVIVIISILAAITIPRLELKGEKRRMNPLQKQNVINDDSTTIHELEPGVYEIWLKDVNKYIKISIEDAGG